MIIVTRLNGSEIVVNADLIETVESTPDTIVTLVDGTRYVVEETPTELVDRIKTYRAAVLRFSDDPVVPRSPEEPAPADVVSLPIERSENEMDPITIVGLLLALGTTFGALTMNGIDPMSIFLADIGSIIQVAGGAIGLIDMLNSLSDPGALGPALAVAFATTLWGVFLANYIVQPIASKLKRVSDIELAFKDLVLAGILSIQAGSSPRAVSDRLVAYLAPTQQEAMQEKKSA